MNNIMKGIGFILFTLLICSLLTFPVAAKSSNKVFVFNPSALYWVVYENGKAIRSGRAVGGKRHCQDIHRPCMTPVGTFHIYAKAGPNFRSSIYPLPHGGASMPWAMFFHKGYAIHGPMRCLTIQQAMAALEFIQVMPDG